MRITGFDIDGFGIFHEAKVSNLPPGLSVFHGNNEAGKSTCLAFVHTVLFGFPDGRSKVQVQYPPLRGGEHGGRLFVSSRAIPEAIIERRPGVRGGPLRVQIGDETGAEQNLAQMLKGVNFTLFRNLYGFSLTELQNLQTLTDDEIRDVIYGASFGGGAQSFSSAVKALQLKRSNLFKPRGSKSEINRFLAEIKAVRDALKVASKGLASYEKASDRIESSEDEILLLKKELSKNRSSAKRCELHLTLWNDWLGLKDARDRISALPILEGDFPDNGVKRLGDLQTQLRTEEKNLRQLGQELQKARTKLSRFEFDDLILEATSDIKSLAAGLKTYENALVEIGRIKDRGQAARVSVDEIVRSFGPGWSEKRALGIDRSAPTIDAIESLRRNLEDARGLEEKLKERINQLLENRNEREAELARDEKKLEALGERGPEIDRQLLSSLRERRELYASVLRDIPHRLKDREAKQRDLKDLLKEIDAKWTTDHLGGVDFSITTRERAQDFEDKIVVAQAQADAALSEMNRRIVEVDEARLPCVAVRRKLDNFGPAEDDVDSADESDRCRKELRELRDLDAQRKIATGELKHLRERLRDVSRPVLMLKCLGTALPVVGAFAYFFLKDQADRPMALVASSLLFIFGIAFFVYGRRRGKHERRIAALCAGAETQIEGMEARITVLKAELLIEGELDTELLDAAEDRLASDLRLYESRKRLHEQLNEAEALLKRRENQAVRAEVELESASTGIEQGEKQWSDFIAGFGLDEHTTPRVFDRVLTRAAAAKQMVKEIDEFSDRIEKMEKTRREYLDDTQALPQLNDVGPEKLVATVDRLHTEVLASDQRSIEIETAENSREYSRTRYDAAIELLGSAEIEIKKAAADRRTAEHAWGTFLEDHGFDSSWSGATTRDMLGRLEKLNDSIMSRDEAASERRRCEAVIEDFKGRTKRLLMSTHRPVPSFDRDFVSEIHRIIEIQESAVVDSSAARATAEDIENRQLSFDAQQDEVRRIIEDLNALFSEGGAEDEAGFRDRAVHFEKRTSLEREITERESRIRTISGAADLQALEAELQNETKADLQAMCDRLENEIETSETRLDQLVRDAADAHAERRNLASNDQIAVLRAEEERLTEEIRERAFQWSRFSIAAHLLDTAKARFEESHQPEVIQYATKFFSEITDGRYQKVFAPHEADHIDVVDAHGKRFSAEVLSRGTQEQLYLAIRFGYIRAREKNSEPLPIIMDDVLVNFDPERAKRAAAAIVEMAKTNQVLFFTCHPSAVDVFRTVDDSLEVYELEDGKIRNG